MLVGQKQAPGLYLDWKLSMENYNMGLGDKDNGAQFLSGTVAQQQQLLVWGQRTDVLPFGLVGKKE